MIAYWDSNARNVVANAAYLEWFGFDPDLMRGLHIRELLGAEVYAKNLPFIEGALRGQVQLFDRTLIDQSGRTRHTQASYVPDFVNGEVHGFFVLVTDVTPRVEAQRAAEHAQALAKLGSWELDPATGELTWSRELFNIVGVEPGDEKPSVMSASEHIHPEDRDRVLANIEHATRSGEPYSITYRIVRTDGQQREVVSNGQPTRDTTGTTVLLRGTLQDVTESNAASRELARINSELRLANALNSDVIAMLGHDIRTPLTSVQGFLELLDENWDTLTDEDRRRMVRRARSSNLRLGTMVDRILALAAIDSGTIAPTTEDADLASALTAIAEASQLPTTPELRIAAGTPATCRFDSVHLEQIIGNLLTNAGRYGAEPIAIEVTPDATGGVAVAVTDGGPGIAPAGEATLFSRFARTGEAQTAARGTGFGLYMSAQLASANGAELTYRAANSSRTHAFVLTIPGPPRAAP